MFREVWDECDNDDQITITLTSNYIKQTKEKEFMNNAFAYYSLFYAF